MKKKILTTIAVTLAASMMISLNVWARSPAEEEIEEVEEAPAVVTKYKEAPMLAALVAKGELPSVDERLPDNPKVISQMIEGIGNYGGELVVMATSDGSNTQDLQGMWGTSFLRTPTSGIGFEPDVAENYDVVYTNSGTPIGMTMYLRKGMKWSDGSDFTTEDIRFMFEDMHWNSDVRTWGSWGINRVEVIDDYTISLFKATNLGTGLFQAANWFGGFANGYQPAAYLKQFHIDYNPDAQKLAEEAGFDNWYDYLRDRWWFNPLRNPDKPQVEPWDLEQITATAKVMVRNPYFHRVDAEGNQLPYIDRLLVQVVDPEVYQLKVAGGEASIAYKKLTLENMQLYVGGEQAGDYRVILHPGVAGSQVKLIVNQTHPDLDRRAILNDVRFRQAISVAVNREEIQNVIYQGLGKARQMAPLSSTSFYTNDWENRYAQYDPDLANGLLDEMGLDARDSDGFRTMANGETLSLVISYTAPEMTSELELVAEYMNAVGLKTSLGLIDTALLTARQDVNEFDFWVHPITNQPWSNERNVFQTNTWGGDMWFAYGDWAVEHTIALKDQYGDDWPFPDNWRRMKAEGDDAIEYEYPSDDWFYVKELADEWARTEMGSKEYIEIAQEFFDFQLKQLYRIGFVGEIPSLMIAKNNLGNVLSPGWTSGMPLVEEYVNTWMDQLYWK